MELRNSKLFPSRAVRVQVFRPAPVRMTAELRSFSAQYHAATQRVPLPEISASEPSAFSRRTTRSASVAGNTHSTPSAPTPLCRSQIRRLKEQISPGAWAKSMIRKSLPQAVALTNGILAISVALGGCAFGHGHHQRQLLHFSCQGFLLRKIGLNCELHAAMVVVDPSHVNSLHRQPCLVEKLVECRNHRIGSLAARGDHVVGYRNRFEIEPRLHLSQDQQANQGQDRRENCGLKQATACGHPNPCSHRSEERRVGKECRSR